MCDTSLYLPRFLSIQSRRSSKLWFSLLSSILELFKVTNRLAKSSVRTVMGIRIIASTFTVTRNLTCRVLPSGIQKIVVIECSPCRENGVHLQWMSSLKCVLLSPVWSKMISIGFVQWTVSYSNRLVHAHYLRWRRVLEETFDKCKVCRLWRTRKIKFLPRFKFFRVNFLTFSGNVVG